MSGGIDLESILLALQDGDVNALKLAVIKSRTNNTILSWDIPLDEWKMPNDEPPLAQDRKTTGTKSNPRIWDLALQFRKFFLIQHAREDSTSRGFLLFLAWRHSMSHFPEAGRLQRLLPIGGVTLSNTIGKKNFDRRNLQGLKGSIQQSRPNTNSLSGDVHN